MLSLTSLFSVPRASSAPAQQLFDLQLDANYRKTDQLFAILMAFQWVAGIAAALWISPRTWEGLGSSPHIHLWAGILLGGALAGFPILMTFIAPGTPATRQAVAIGQMLTSGLLVHLTGGRIETHFHYFGSLAFLAFYRDWRVLATATVIAAGDHLLRGIYWPQSIFGVANASHWRWLEHAGWVVFEDIFLLIAIRKNLQESLGLAERQAQLSGINQVIEKTVQDRTLQLEEAHKELQEMSRQAGMAQVATSVLHNVGNVLNSVNVSSNLITESTRRSKLSSFPKIISLLSENQANLPVFLTQDPRGKQLMPYLSQLSQHLLDEQDANLKELESLRKNIEHIKTIVSMQQNYAKITDLKERLSPVELVEDSIKMNVGILTRSNIQVIRDFQSTAGVSADKHQAIQILVNLIKNAAQACTESPGLEKRITVRITKNQDDIQIAIIDNGVGISPENLDRIFNQGFTTKKDGHGFGLHSASLAAKQMSGSLTATSPGPGSGATFTLQLPCPTHAPQTPAPAPTPQPVAH